MIHPQAIIEPGAQLAEDVEIGPWTYIGADVEIAAGTRIGSHVVIKGPTLIGKSNRIFQFASIGEDCQDLKYKGEPTRLEIGDNNQFREGCTIHRGTIQDKGVTRIGSDNLFMAYVHVAHDCIVGNNNIFANNATIAGHVEVAHDAILGGFSGVHQFCKVGAHSMLSMGSMVHKDVPAFVLVSGDPARAYAMNVEGMRRRDYAPATITTLRKAYKVVYRQQRKVEDALLELASWPALPQLDWFIDSIKASERGIIR